MPKPRIFKDRFGGRTAIVTGAGSVGDGMGIGRAIALAFAAEGTQLCLVDRDEEQAKRTLAMVKEAGANAILICGDVSDEDLCQYCVTETVSAFGSLDILVNNVGVTGPREDATAINIDQWSSTFDINVKSTLMLAHGAIPYMARSGGGAIVNITSVASLLAHGALAYGPSKAALEALTKEIALMHGSDGIRANNVAPGYLWTPMAEQSGGGEAARKTRREIAPMGVEGDAWDVASAVLFLASDEARFITGITLPVDGGAMATAPIAAHGRMMAATTKD